MAIQSFEDVLSLLSGDVPAVVFREARDDAKEFGALVADLQKDTGSRIDGKLAQKIVERVDSYLNPRDPQGDFVISAEKAGVRWNWSTGRVSNNFPIALTAGQQLDASVSVQATGSMRGDLEFAAMMLTATGRVATQIKVPYLQRELSNVLVSANLMWGNAQLPALMAQTLLSLPTAAWTVKMKDLSNSANTVSPVFWGRRFTDRAKERLDQVRRAMLFSQFMHPYIIGPTMGVITGGGALAGGPEVVISAGQTATLRFDLGGCDYDWRWIMDDSTQADGLEPNLTAQILIGDAATPLMDTPISWRDFVAAPTVSVIGMKQIAGIAHGIAAASCPSPGTCWSMLVRRGTKLQIAFTNTNVAPNNITLRPGLGGIALYAPSDLQRLSKASAGDIQNHLGGR